MIETAPIQYSKLASAASIDYTPEGWIGVNPSGKAYALGPALAVYARTLAVGLTQEDLRSRLIAETGAEWSDADLATANGQLARLGFLDEYVGARESRKRRIRYVPPLTVQLTLGNPERLFGALERVLRRVRTRIAFVVAALSVVGGGIAVYVNREMVIFCLAQPLTLVEYLLLVVMMTAATALHEAGHAAALARLGGRPKRVGVMLFYLMPAFFCDVSDAWRVGTRRQRALVAASGVLVQVTLAGLAEVVAATLPGDQPVARALAAFGILSFLAALVNAIPFVKFDGYIALMALTGHNFLRRDAIGEGRRLIARTFITRKVRYEFPDSRWIRWYGLGCILFPAYLVVSAMWLWLSQLKAFGIVGGLVGIISGMIFAVAIVREMVMIARVGISAGGRLMTVLGGAAILTAVVVATFSLARIPTVTVAGYTSDDAGVKLVLPAGKSPADVARPTRVQLHSNGLFLHRGNVSTQIPADANFREDIVPLSAIAAVQTQLFEFRGQTVRLQVDVPKAELDAMAPTGQAVIYGPSQPLWRAVWQAFF